MKVHLASPAGPSPVEVSPFKIMFSKLFAPDRKLRDATIRQLQRLNSESRVAVVAMPSRGYRSRKARSSGVMGWLMTRSGISQMISRGGLSRNVTPAK